MGGSDREGRNSKAQQRIEAAAARKAAQQVEQRRRRTTRIIAIASIALVVVVGVVVSISKNATKGHASAPPSAVKADGYGLVFNPLAKPVIDVWEDFQCPACGQFEKVNGTYLNEVVKLGKAKVVFHTLSFIGPESTTLANAGACADKTGQYLEFHSYVYDHQVRENSGYWGKGSVIAGGKAAGITSPEFASCVSDGTYSAWVQNIASDGASKNINQTPTVLVNGKEIDRKSGTYVDAALFKAALAAAGVK